MAFFFESGHASQSEANRTMNLSLGLESSREMLGYVSHSFVDKKKFPCIQAADLLAWQMFTDWKHGKGRKPRRKDFVYLIEAKDHRFLALNPEHILKHVGEMTEMGRSGRRTPLRSCHPLEGPLELFLALGDASLLCGFLEPLVLLGWRQLGCLALGHAYSYSVGFSSAI